MTVFKTSFGRYMKKLLKFLIDVMGGLPVGIMFAGMGWPNFFSIPSYAAKYYWFTVYITSIQNYTRNLPQINLI